MIGVVLGKAFDAALGIMVKNWRIVLIVWAAFAVAFVCDQIKFRPFAGLVEEASSTVTAIIVCGTLCLDFRWNTRTIARFWGTSILYFFATIGVPVFVTTIALAVMIPLTSATGTSIFVIEILFLIAIGVIPFVFWTATRSSMAVTLILVENLPVLGSFARSWELTHDRFWVSAGFNVAVTLGVFAISLAPSSLVVAAFHTFHPSASFDITNGFLNAVLAPVLIYAQFARWTAYVRWLEWLKASQKLEAASA